MLGKGMGKKLYIVLIVDECIEMDINFIYLRMEFG